MKLHYELMSWCYHRHSPACYELILKDWNIPCSGFEFRTGYTSSSLKEIIHAIWYLTGARYCVHLTAQQEKILDMIEKESLSVFTVFASTNRDTRINK